MEAVLRKPSPDDSAGGLCAHCPRRSSTWGVLLRHTCLRWVLAEYSGARKRPDGEQGVAGRLTHAEQRLHKHLEWVFTPEPTGKTAAPGSSRARSRPFVAAEP